MSGAGQLVQHGRSRRFLADRSPQPCRIEVNRFNGGVKRMMNVIAVIIVLDSRFAFAPSRLIQVCFVAPPNNSGSIQLAHVDQTSTFIR
jgi:hypothetical protein